MLSEQLRQLSEEQKPKSMDELFGNSKEQMLFEQVNQSLQEAVRQIKESMSQEMGATISRLVQQTVSQIKVKDGRDGRDAKPGRDGTDGKDGKDATINKEDIIAEITKKIPPVSVSSRRGGGGGSTVRTDDLSSQADGSNKTFNTTYKIGTALILSGTQFPVILRPTVDYTVGSTSITLTAAVGAPESGQSLIFVYIEG